MVKMTTNEPHIADVAASISQPAMIEAEHIAPLTHIEAGIMARVELERFLGRVKTLSAADWDQPTDCTLWNVRQVLAHQAGAYAGFASWSQFMRQWSQLFKKRQPGQFSVDLVNQLQVADRANASPAELIAELSEVGPKAIATRQRLPAALRALRFPFGPPLGFVRFDYLTDLIYTRDTWSHRLDICRATGREMVLTSDHDGRMLALVMRDLAGKLHLELKDSAIAFKLTGTAGGNWRVGPGENPVASIQMDALDFSRLSSGRLNPDEARDQSLVVINGDAQMANYILANTSVPY